MAGLCHSMTFIIVLIHAVEVASHEYYRHKIILTVGLVLGYSHFLPAILLPRELSAHVMNQMIGFEYIILAFLAFIANTYYTKESPTHLLLHGDPNNHIETLTTYELYKFLQTGPVSVPQLSSQFDKLKSYVFAEKEESSNILSNGNLITILFCVMIRLISVLTFNFADAYYLLLIHNLSGAGANALPLVAFILICGSITTIFIFNHRNYVYLIAVVFSFIHVIIIFCFLCNFWFMDIYQSIVPLFIAVISGVFFVYCFSLPLDIVSIIPLSEAFPLSKKPLSMAVVIVVEHLLRILLASLAIFKKDGLIWITITIGLFVFCCVAFSRLPQNTGQLPLEKCPKVYRSRRSESVYIM